MIQLNYARRSQRRAIDLNCDVTGRQWDEPMRQHVVDISPHGVWIRTTLPLRVGEKVVLSFRPPHWGKELHVFASVRRTVRSSRGRRRSGMGLEFTDLSRWERRYLQYCLKGLPSLERARKHVVRTKLPL